MRGVQSRLFGGVLTALLTLGCIAFVLTASSITMGVTFADAANELSYTLQHEFIVVDGLDTETLGGLDLLKKFFGSLEFSAGTMTIRADLLPDDGKERCEDRGNSSDLTVDKPAVVPARGVQKVYVRYDRKLCVGDNIPIICQPVHLISKEGGKLTTLFPPTLMDANSCTQPGRFRLVVQNHSDKDIQLTRGDVVGTAHAVPGGRSALRTSSYTSNKRAIRLTRVDGAIVETEAALASDHDRPSSSNSSNSSGSTDTEPDHEFTRERIESVLAYEQTFEFLVADDAAARSGRPRPNFGHVYSQAEVECATLALAVQLTEAESSGLQPVLSQPETQRLRTAANILTARARIAGDRLRAEHAAAQVTSSMTRMPPAVVYSMPYRARQKRHEDLISFLPITREQLYQRAISFADDELSKESPSGTDPSPSAESVASASS